MDKRIPFDLLNSPLQGMNLIEASAGTGKTFTIAGLFLRLILEKGFLVNEILVMTFTEAATAELKERIRSALQAALKAFTEGRGDEGFFRDLVRRHDASGQRALQRLEDALRQFDEAAIHTIHGFCGRILQENAFETGLPFGMALTADEKKVKEEILFDFWRRHFYHESPLFFWYARARGGRLEDLQRLIVDQALDPSLTLLPDAAGRIDTTRAEQAFLTSFHALQRAWRKDRAEVERILTEHESLNRNKYRKASIPLWLEELHEFLSVDNPAPVLPPSFSKFTTREIGHSLKKDEPSGELLEYPFFRQCERVRAMSEKLERAFASRLVETKKNLLLYMAKELVKRKESREILFFDDLLTRLWQGLSGMGGKGLLSQIRKRYQAALIDEFQDTDPLQYAIFRKIFDSEGKILFMIGDPKQAIYGFRGADVFAYIKGAREAQARFGLPLNWRSNPELIEAINAIFGNRTRPFLYEEIPFSEAEPAPRNDIDHLTLEGEEAPSFHLWFLPPVVAGSEKPHPKEAGRLTIAEAVAWEIGRLLSLGRQRRALIGNKAVSAEDIAVLVRKNRDAALVQRHLSELRIPSVLHSTGNLFDTHEARELERVLAGIVGALEGSRLMTALSTDMLGFKGGILDAMKKDASLMEAWAVKMREYHEIWSGTGFYPMFRRIVQEGDVLPRLMSYQDGERRVTNLLHLAELLHQHSMKERLSMEGLMKWLAVQRMHPQFEEHLLRLESDENAVRIMTIHKSKGLEYPIVFCPFSWDGSKLRSEDSLLFHDPAMDRRLTLDLGSPKRDEYRILAEEEILSENLRLLYVALTRAKVCCYLVWGRFNQTATSAPAYLFHDPRGRSRKDVVGHTEQWIKSLDSKAMLRDLDRLCDNAKGHIHVSEPPKKSGPFLSPPQKKPQSLVYRAFQGNIDTSWRIASFSSLISGWSSAVDWADRDEEDITDHSPESGGKEAEDNRETRDLFSFPRGTMAGFFFHDLLENFDFMERNPDALRDLVACKLQQHNLDREWQETVVCTLNRVLSVTLKIGEEAFSLSQISPRQRLNELAFYYPLKRTSPRGMFHLMFPLEGRAKQGQVPETLGKAFFSAFKGYMKGYIDLVFEYGGRYFIVDWKSNYLGNQIEDYGPEALARAMDRGYYGLQWRIYALALHQYLKQKVSGYHYGTHFGEVLYIFLRGLDPTRGQAYGIYRCRPSEKQIEKWVTDLIP